MHPSLNGSPYRLIREDRRHGCLITYVAQDGNGRTVSVQMINAVSSAAVPPPPEYAGPLRAFVHPRAVRVIELGLTASQQPYLVSAYCEAISLWSRCSFRSESLTTTHRLGIEKALTVLAQVAHALDAAHDIGLVHGAVEPGAILLLGAEEIAAVPKSAFAHEQDTSGSVESKLANFGMAFLINSDPTRQVSAAAMDARSPELVAGGPPTSRSDQFSLAAVAYWMLTGFTPFDGLSRAFPKALFPGEEALGALPPPVDTVLRKAMAESAQSRYATCQEFVESLSAAVTSRPKPDSKAPLQAGRIVSAEYPISDDLTAKRFVLDIADSFVSRLVLGAIVFAILFVVIYAARLVDWFKDYIASP
jgi:serine/threonine protein kinase